MGFWSSLGSAISSVAKTVISTVSSGISNLVSGAVTWIKENILNLNETPSYNPETATVDETKKINELIEKCIDGDSKESKKCDRETIEIVEEHFKQIVKKLKKVNEGEETAIIDGYVFDMFEIRVEEIKRNLENIYSKQISNVFSLNNNILLDILRMNKGIEKKNKLNNLAKLTLERAYQKIKDTSEKVIDEQQDFIIQKLVIYIENRHSLLETSKKETEKIIQTSEGDKEERLKLQTKYDNIIDKLDLLENLMRV